MAKRFLTGLTLANLPTDPVSGSEGQLYYNTTSDKIRIYINGAWTDLSASLDEIHDVRITSIEDGDIIIWNSASSLWLNESLQDKIDTEVSSLFIHNNHENISASYNSASNFIILSACPGGGDTGLFTFGFDPPTEGSGTEDEIYYQISAGSNQLLGVFEYVNGTWINLLSETNEWSYLLNSYWLDVVNSSASAGGWNWVIEGQGTYDETSLTYNERYVPHLVADLKYISKLTGEITGNKIKFNSTESGSPSLNAIIEVERGTENNVAIRWNESLDVWEFTTDGTEYNELGSGGGALIYQPEQPDTTSLEVGTVWIDSDQPVGSGLDIATFKVWNKTLAASASIISGLDDDGNSLLYVQDLETVYINGTLLIRNQDYTATSGSSIVLSEAATSGDVITVHSLEDILFTDTYRKSEIDTLLENIDALPEQSGNSGKFLTTDGTTADWATIVTGSASFFRWRKTYAASATLISGADDNAINLEYTPGLEQVYINGVMIATNEYTATSGSTIVLNDAVSASDVVDIFGYTSINTTSTYSQAQIDAKYNNLVRWKKAYSASATVISGLDDYSVSLSYTPNYEQVYLNGILLTPITDYARTSASVITLGQAVISGDIIEVIGYAPFNVAEEVLPYSTSTPASPIAGSVWVDSTNPASPLLKVYNGSTWVSVSGGDSGLHPFFTAGI